MKDSQASKIKPAAPHIHRGRETQFSTLIIIHKQLHTLQIRGKDVAQDAGTVELREHVGRRAVRRSRRGRDSAGTPLRVDGKRKEE